MAHDPEIKTQNEGWTTFKQNDPETKKPRGRGRPPKFRFADEAAASTESARPSDPWDEEKWDGNANSEWFRLAHLHSRDRDTLIRAALENREFTIENVLRLHKFLSRKDAEGYSFGGASSIVVAVRSYLSEAAVGPPTKDSGFLLSSLQERDKQ